MFGTGEISSILTSLTPPYLLMREDKFPNCAKIFEDLSNKPPRPRSLGVLFTSVCRLTGMVWVIWGFNVTMFSTLVLIVLYHWGKSLDMSELVISAFSCKMFISMIGALLFVGSMVSFGARSLALQFADKCYEHLGTSPSVVARQSTKINGETKEPNSGTRSARKTRIKTAIAAIKNDDEVKTNNAAN
jgi:hypothetical protein